MYEYILKRINHHSSVIDKINEGKRNKTIIHMSLGALVELQFLIEMCKDELTYVQRNEVKDLIKIVIMRG